MAYDKKFREQVLKFIDKGHTIKEAHKMFEVGTATIKVWRRLKRETGKLEKRPLVRKPKKICPIQLEAYINEHPDSYLAEIAEVFNCSSTAVWKAFKRLGITRKKNGALCGKQPSN